MSQPCSRSLLTTKLCTEPSRDCSPPKWEVILRINLSPGLTVMIAFFSPGTLKVLSLSAITSITRGLSGAGLSPNVPIPSKAVASITAPVILLKDTFAPLFRLSLDDFGSIGGLICFGFFRVLFGSGFHRSVLEVAKDRLSFFLGEIRHHTHVH